MSSSHIDVLAAVYRFILQYAKDESRGIPALTEDQIVRAWENYAVLPDTTEYVVITLAGSVQHGRSQVEEVYNEDTDFLEYEITGTMEHTVQVDFTAQGPQRDPGLTQHRAQIIQVLCASEIGPSFFKKYDSSLNLMYCNDVGGGATFDESQNWAARYVLDLHISQLLTSNVPFDYFTSARIRTEDVDVHHKVK